MQAAQNLFAGEQGVAYIPMPKGRGFTPVLIAQSASGCNDKAPFVMIF